MSNLKQEVLGLAVFGTMRGLFASGNGVLSGVANSAEIFELRHSDPQDNLVPIDNGIVLFRRAVSTSNGDFLDLIGVARAAEDLERRKGFLGICAAVKYGMTSCYQASYDAVADSYQDVVRLYLHADQIQDIKHHCFLPNKNGPQNGVTYKRLDGAVRPIGLVAPWQDIDKQQTLFSCITAAVELAGQQAPTIAVFDQARPGARPLTAELLDSLQIKIRERDAKEEQQKVAVEREAAANLTQRVQRLEDRLRLLEANLQKSLSRSESRTEHRTYKSPPRAPREYRNTEQSNLDWRLVIYAGLAILILASLVLGVFFAVSW